MEHLIRIRGVTFCPSGCKLRARLARRSPSGACKPGPQFTATAARRQGGPLRVRSTVAVRRRCPNNYALLERAPSPAVTRDPGTSDSLNISPRACWVVCPLGSTRGHGRRVMSLTVAIRPSVT